MAIRIVRRIRIGTPVPTEDQITVDKLFGASSLLPETEILTACYDWQSKLEYLL